MLERNMAVELCNTQMPIIIIDFQPTVLLYYYYYLRNEVANLYTVSLDYFIDKINFARY